MCAGGSQEETPTHTVGVGLEVTCPSFSPGHSAEQSPAFAHSQGPEKGSRNYLRCSPHPPPLVSPWEDSPGGADVQ